MPRVIIVGAGVSGLGAARYLEQKGFEVVILESRNRIGGRIYSQTIGDCPIEYGANWMHDVFSHPLLHEALQLPMNIILEGFGLEKTTFYASGGRVFDTQIVKEVNFKYGKILDVIRTTEDFSVPKSVEDSLLAHTSKLNLSADEAQILNAIWNLNEGYENANLNELSSFHFFQADTFLQSDILDAYVSNEYDSLVHKIAREITSKVRLNTRVISISQTKDSAKVETFKGDIIEADHVLVTVPLGVLQKKLIQFQPPLPDLKLQAIDRMGFGLHNKIFLRFPKLFWPPHTRSLVFTSDRKDGLHYRIRYFFNLYLIHQKPVLAVYVPASLARELENLSDQEIIEVAMNTLREMFPVVPQPSDYRITRWSKEIDSLGSYSFIKKGSSFQDVEILSQPFGRIGFSGEATAQVIGTVNSAYNSGIREAKRLCNCCAPLAHL